MGILIHLLVDYFSVYYYKNCVGLSLGQLSLASPRGR